jgi:uncharacterized protein (TIGR02265 family)
VDNVVYKEAITSTLDAVRSQLTPRIRERLKAEAGFNIDAMSPTYPLTVLDETIRVLSEEFFGGRAPDEATYELGRVALKRYGEGTLGKALFPLVRMLGPMRFLKRLPSLFRQTNNYADVKVEVLSPTSYELDHNEVGRYPHYMRGVMQSAGEVIGLKGHACDLLSYDGHRARYRMRWEP